MPNFIEIGGVTRKPLVDLTRNDPIAISSNADLTYFANRRASENGPAINVNNVKKCARGTRVAGSVSFQSNVSWFW